MKDASLKAQPSLFGVVVDKKLFSRANKDGKKSKASEKAQLEKMETEFLQQADALKERLIEKLWTLLKDKSTIGIRDYFGVELVPQGDAFLAENAGRTRLPEYRHR